MHVFYLLNNGLNKITDHFFRAIRGDKTIVTEFMRFLDLNARNQIYLDFQNQICRNYLHYDLTPLARNFEGKLPLINGKEITVTEFYEELKRYSDSLRSASHP